jgi:calcineurin-like phosphoesterase family protein
MATFGETAMARVEAMNRFVPEQGFNLVGVDSYEEAGDELYLIGHFATRELAEKAKVDAEKKTPGESVYIYGPEDKI